MCNALSPERAVIWALLHAPARAAALELTELHFQHAPYAACFALCLKGGVAPADLAGFSAAEARGLRRMLEMPPPERIRAHLGEFAATLRDRQAGRRPDLLALIN